jgi:hypothetical protein
MMIFLNFMDESKTEKWMQNAKANKPTRKKMKRVERAPYESPAIIYEGLITTRAASRTSPDRGPDGSIDPADIFSSDS